MMRLITFFVATLLFCGASGCSAPKPPAERAYYFWKSDFRLSPNEKRQLWDTLQVKKLYLKYFDVAWNAATQQPLPLDNMTIATEIPSNIGIVPTVFITNETFLRIDSADIDTLARHIATKIIEKTDNATAEAQFKTSVNEWQIDCDWSAKTKNKYFAFLRALKTYFPQKTQKMHRLSATIRLHQLKYPKKTGVPPVSRGMLMLYNMSNVRLRSTKNSIIDTDITAQYINERTAYALPLDVALPAFAWSAAFRGDAFQGLYNNWTEDFCAKQPFLQKSKNAEFICVRDTEYQAHYWRVGDALRCESTSAADISRLYNLTQNLYARDTVRIALFSWDTALYRFYTEKKLNGMYEAFE